MSSDYNTIGTLPLGFLASADGNYAPGASSGAGDVAAVFRPRGSTSEVASQINQTTRQDNPPSEEGGYSNSQAVLIDLGPYNERIEDLNPHLVNALRELVRQYRQKGVVAAAARNSPHPVVHRRAFARRPERAHRSANRSINALNQQFLNQQQQTGSLLNSQFQSILNNPGLSPADNAAITGQSQGAIASAFDSLA